MGTTLFFKQKGMKSFILLTVVIMTALNSSGQKNRTRLRINIGFQQTNIYNKPFYTQQEQGFVPTEQKAHIFPDINLLYLIPSQIKKLNFEFGIGLNQKGIREKGFDFLSDPAAHYYSVTVRNTYLDFFCGASYEKYLNLKTSIRFGQFLVPEIDLNSSNIYKRIAFSTRSMITLSNYIKNHVGFSFGLFFQTSLSKYSSKKISPASTNYFPYSIGVTVGVSF